MEPVDNLLPDGDLSTRNNRLPNDSGGEKSVRDVPVSRVCPVAPGFGGFRDFPVGLLQLPGRLPFFGERLSEKRGEITSFYK